MTVDVVTNLTCHVECRGRCFGDGAGQCCDPECAGGCYGPGNKRCWVSILLVLESVEITLSTILLPRDAMHSAKSAVARRLSVRMSVRPVLHQKRLKGEGKHFLHGDLICRYILSEYI